MSTLFIQHDIDGKEKRVDVMPDSRDKMFGFPVVHCDRVTYKMHLGITHLSMYKTGVRGVNIDGTFVLAWKIRLDLGLLKRSVC